MGHLDAKLRLLLHPPKKDPGRSSDSTWTATTLWVTVGIRLFSCETSPTSTDQSWTPLTLLQLTLQHVLADPPLLVV